MWAELVRRSCRARQYGRMWAVVRRSPPHPPPPPAHCTPSLPPSPPQTQSSLEDRRTSICIFTLWSPRLTCQQGLVLRSLVKLHQDEHHVGGQQDEVWRGGRDDVPLVGGVRHAHAVSQSAMTSAWQVFTNFQSLYKLGLHSEIKEYLQNERELQLRDIKCINY